MPLVVRYEKHGAREHVVVQAVCDECGVTAVTQKRLRVNEDIAEAKVVVRANGWRFQGRTLLCPRHKQSGKARKE